MLGSIQSLGKILLVKFFRDLREGMTGITLWSPDILSSGWYVGMAV